MLTMSQAEVTRHAAVKTPLGTVHVCCHNRDSFYMGAGTKYDEGAVDPLPINGVPYRISGQIALTPGEGWAWSGGRYRKGPDLSRAGSFKMDDWTWAAKKKADTVLLAALAEWAESPEGKAARVAGEMYERAAIRGRYVETLDALRQALDETTAALALLDDSADKPPAYPLWRVEQRP